MMGEPTAGTAAPLPFGAYAWAAVGLVGAPVLSALLPAPAILKYLALALGVACGVAAIVLGARSRRRGAPAVVAVIAGAVAVVVCLVLASASVMTSVRSPALQVELRASAEVPYSISYDRTDTPTVDTWQGGDWRTLFGSWNDTITMTVTTDDAQPADLTCEILVEGQRVAQESGNGASLSCIGQAP